MRKGKGMFLSIAAATALLVSSTGINSADASQIQVKTYKVGYQINQADMNQMIERMINQVDSQYDININELMKQIEQGNYSRVVTTPQVVSEPTNTTPAPKQSAPAPKQSEPAPKQPAPVPTQSAQAPTQSAPAPKQPAPVPTQSAQAPTQSAPSFTNTVKEPTNEETSTISAYEQEVVDLTNAERAKYGLAPLKVDEQLSEVAGIKSADMQSKGYFDHTSPTYGSPFDMMKSFGVSYTSAAENIAYGQQTPEEVVKAWMNSDGHRKNILNSSYTHIGVGFVEQGNYWTQMFIGK